MLRPWPTSLRLSSKLPNDRYVTQVSLTINYFVNRLENQDQLATYENYAQINAFEDKKPVAPAESPAERKKRQDAELIKQTVDKAQATAAAAAVPKTAPAAPQEQKKTVTSAEPKPTGPPATENVAAGVPITPKEPMVSAIVGKEEQMAPAMEAINKAVVDAAKQRAQNKANAEIIAKMNKQITEANKKKQEENQKEAEEIREQQSKKEEADKRVAKEEKAKREADLIVKKANEEQ